MPNGMPNLEMAYKRLIYNDLGGGPRRLHITNDPALSLKKYRSCYKQKADRKPKGLWYGIDDSWMDWCLSEASGWLSPYIYEILLEESGVFKITNLEEFTNFERTHYGLPEYMRGQYMPEIFMPADFHKWVSYTYMDFGKVAERFGAMEITPYLYERRLESIWYYSWDCASGCVWDRKIIKDIRLFASYDPEKDDFTLQHTPQRV